jgi:predicted metal-dependent hydrolase
MALSLGRMEISAAALERGRVHFTSGRFFEARETWEAAWRAESGLMRRVLQGLILAAGAYQKMAARQPRGMTLLLERAIERLGPAPDGFGGLELDRFRAGLDRSLAEGRAWLAGAPPPSGPAPLATTAVSTPADAPAWRPGA